ncbi:MAG: hypothetical protein JWN14_6 [Chthonomonadales bacterium]|nr:hypothetical protein [Chthonomonadales bacterium]
MSLHILLDSSPLGLFSNPNASIVATSNVGHISRFVAADQWNNILP